MNDESNGNAGVASEEAITTTAAVDSTTITNNAQTTTSRTETTTAKVVCSSEQSSSLYTRYPDRYRRSRPKKRLFHPLLFVGNEKGGRKIGGQREERKVNGNCGISDDNNINGGNEREDVYKINANEVLLSCEGMKMNKRPLPSMMTMASVSSFASQQQKQRQQQQLSKDMEMTRGGHKKKKNNEDSTVVPSIPILHSFLRSIGEKRTISPSPSSTMKQQQQQQNHCKDTTRTIIDGTPLSITNTDSTLLNETSQMQQQQQQEQQQQQNDNTNNTTKSSSSLPTIVLIDNENKSTLTKGQHSRYKHLLLKMNFVSSSLPSKEEIIKMDPQTRSRFKEYQTLEKVIKEEKLRYCQALMEFRDCRECLDRFLIGFTVQFCKKRWKINSGQMTNDDDNRRHRRCRHNQPTKYYAKYSQSISLSSVCTTVNETDLIPPHLHSGSSRVNSGKRGTKQIHKSLDLDSFSPCIVKVVGGTQTTKTNLEWIKHNYYAKNKGSNNNKNSINTRLISPKMSSISSIKTTQCINIDNIARSLAVEYDVNAVMTRETFETLLKRPGHDSTRWMIPITVEMKKDVLMENEHCSHHQNQAANKAVDSGDGGVTSSGPSRTSSITAPEKSIVFMEEPIPQASTPRECLTRGFQQSLLENFGKVSSSEINDSEQKDRLQYVYTVLTLPPPNSIHHHYHQSMAPFRVLVRSTNVLLVDDDHNEGNDTTDNAKYQSSSTATTSPVHIRAQLEYFYNDRKGSLEEYAQHDRAVWIMDKLLQPTCRTLIGRVDPTNATLVQWEEKSVADALMGVFSGSNRGGKEATIARMLSPSLYAADFDPSAHFQTMEEVVRATGKIGLGQHLMCFPGRGIPSSAMTSSSIRTSVSLHTACEDDGDDGGSGISIDCKDEARTNTPAKKSEDMIDIDQELREADAVYMGQQSLKLCFRPWVWDSEDGRVPFTFPMKVDE